MAVVPGPKDILAAGLAELAVDVSEAQLDALSVLASELERWGARINLTGHRSAEAIAKRLILDAAALLQVLPPFPSLADLGAGAGFPGLPIAILAPERTVVLVESRERRHFFQREMIRRLGLDQVRAVHGRFDEVEPIGSGAVIAQAVASPEALAPQLLRWALPRALLLIPGGSSPRGAAPGKLGLAPRTLEYRVPLGGPMRTVWTAKAP
jgi:16S rRNA (guanine527-N7)-methyltransferase